jgi:hypothetical protein
METPDTPAQSKAREEYNEACRNLAAASVTLKDAQAKYERAHAAYLIALGVATQAGVLTK